MKSLHIDFAPRTLRRCMYRTTALTWLFGGVGLALCISAGLAARTLLNSNAAQEATLSHLNAALQRRNAPKPLIKQAAITEEQAGAVNHAIAQLNLPWHDMLDAVQAATPNTIAMLALEPDAKRRMLQGTAEAKNSADMIAYIENLKRQAFFAEVVLTRHEINEQDPDRPLRFQFEAIWAKDTS
ncbi:Tfp pilus assembly protein PilN [Collimonas sp. OK307]|uniref:hypothetical protein n=1 Tax=Collimonas sp. OK307 TaxID=1801620 RepID=UPI0008E30BAD|nr:hypothetical protein [Collimonas sp. OK307]SFI21985.1 Tfp pilus assembly protein PilN [Collimonas sp. OK307]